MKTELYEYWIYITVKPGNSNTCVSAIIQINVVWFFSQNMYWHHTNWIENKMHQLFQTSLILLSYIIMWQKKRIIQTHSHKPKVWQWSLVSKVKAHPIHKLNYTRQPVQDNCTQARITGYNRSYLWTRKIIAALNFIIKFQSRWKIVIKKVAWQHNINKYFKVGKMYTQGGLNRSNFQEDMSANDTDNYMRRKLIETRI